MATAFLVVGACRGSQSSGSSAGTRTVVASDAWVRFTVDTGTTTAAYLTLRNGFPDTVTVSGFRSDAARAVELHESMQDSHMMMHMTPKPDLRIPPGATVALRPGGLHLMLIGTRRPLTAGDTVRITMHVSDGPLLSVTARVRAP